MHMTRISALAIPLLLSGCVSIPKTGATFPGVAEAQPDQALVYVYAPETPCVDLGQMAADIFIDDAEELTIDEGHYRLLTLPAGSYALHASTDDQMACGGRLNPGRRYDPVQLETRPGEIYFLRYSSHPVRCASTCDRSLKPVTEAEARDELQGLAEIAER